MDLVLNGLFWKVFLLSCFSLCPSLQRTHTDYHIAHFFEGKKGRKKRREGREARRNKASADGIGGRTTISSLSTRRKVYHMKYLPGFRNSQRQTSNKPYLLLFSPPPPNPPPPPPPGLPLPTTTKITCVNPQV